MTLINVLYLYIFDEFCWKKMLNVHIQSWIYFFVGHPVYWVDMSVPITISKSM